MPSLEDKGTWFAVAKMMFDRSLRWSFQYLTVVHHRNEHGRGRLGGDGWGKHLSNRLFGCFFLRHNETAPWENWWFFRKGDLTTLFMVWGGTQPPTCWSFPRHLLGKWSSIAHSLVTKHSLAKHWPKKHPTSCELRGWGLILSLFISDGEIHSGLTRLFSLHQEY